jgi:hypothetical protein
MTKDKPLAALLALALGGCATAGGGAGPEIPEGATEASRTEPNGDVITEYRVGTQLRVVKVVPARGPVYYLYDRDGDGIVDDEGENPPQTWYKLFEW